MIAAMLEEGLQKCVNQNGQEEVGEEDWVHYLSAKPIPVELEKDK